MSLPFDRGTIEFFLMVCAIAIGFQMISERNAPSPEQASGTAVEVRAEALDGQTVSPTTSVSQENWTEAGSYYYQGNKARRAGRLEEAEELYTRSLDLVDSLPHCWNNRGWTRVLMARFDEALYDAEKAISLTDDPEMLMHSHHTRASALKGLGRIDEALEAVEDSLSFDPNFSDSLQLKAELLSHEPVTN